MALRMLCEFFRVEGVCKTKRDGNNFVRALGYVMGNAYSGLLKEEKKPWSISMSCISLKDRNCLRLP